MKKVFLFLLGMVLAGTVCAGEVSFSFDLNNYNVWPGSEAGSTQGTYAAATKTFTASQAWGGGSIWLGDYDVTAYAYSRIVFELEAASESLVQLQVQYTDADGSASQVCQIAAGKTRNSVMLTGAHIMQLNIQAAEADKAVQFKSLTLVGMRGAEVAETLETSSSLPVAFGEWTSGFGIANSQFAHAHKGAKLVFTYTTNAEAAQQWWQIKTLSNEVVLTGNADDLSEYGDAGVAGGSTSYTIFLSESDVTNLQNYGLWVSGHELSVSKVELVYYKEKVETVLSSEEKLLSWNGTPADYYQFASADIPDWLCAGTVVRVSTKEGLTPAENSCVKLSNGSWSDLTNLAQIYDAAYTETYLDFVLDAANASVVVSTGLVVCGSGYTVTEIKVIPPVASYSVTYTADGYASFCGPQAVTLPTGVTAFVGTLADDALTLSAVVTEGETLAAGVPVILKKSATATEDANILLVSEDTPKAISAVNSLAGTVSRTEQYKANTTVYVLGQENDQAYFGLYWQKNIPAMKAYLRVDNPESGAPARIRFATQTPTDLETVRGAEKVQKTLVNGQFIITRDGRSFTVQGQSVKL